MNWWQLLDIVVLARHGKEGRRQCSSESANTWKGNAGIQGQATFLQTGMGCGSSCLSLFNFFKIRELTRNSNTS